MADEESVRDGLDFVYDSILTSGCIFEFHWLAEFLRQKRQVIQARFSIMMKSVTRREAIV
jgi:hypothetical protein